MKFNYSTRLNPSEKAEGTNRVTLVAPNIGLMVINKKKTFFNIVTDDLPFTEAIKRAYVAVLNDTEMEYFNIGSKPSSHFIISDVEILHINYMMFLISMRRAQARHTWFKTLPHYFTSYVREDILSSLSIHKLKLTTLRILNNGWSPASHSSNIRAAYKEAGFSEETALLYMLFWRSGEALKMIKELVTSGEPFLLDLDSLVEETNLVIQESNMESLATHYAAKKLTFIANSNRYDISDFSAELLNRARLSYIHCRPFLGRQHSLNYARATISTYVLRIINHFTDESRARLFNHQDGGYDNRCVALDDSYSTGFREDDLIAMIDMKREMVGH